MVMHKDAAEAWIIEAGSTLRGRAIDVIHHRRHGTFIYETDDGVLLLRFWPRVAMWSVVTGLGCNHDEITDPQALQVLEDTIQKNWHPDVIGH